MSLEKCTVNVMKQVLEKMELGNKSVKLVECRRLVNQVIEEGLKECVAHTTCDCIVVGAGLGGLATAQQLAKNFKNIVVLETQSFLGGRMQTTPSKTEKCPWRIHKLHKRMRQLATDMGIPLETTMSSHAVKQNEVLVNATINTHAPILTGLTQNQSNMVQYGPEISFKLEQGTGYLGILDGIKPAYTTPANSSSTFYVPSKGMHTFITKLATKVRAAGVKIQTNARVAHIAYNSSAKEYTLTVVRRLPGNNKFKQETLFTKRVVLNCQPVHFPSTNFPRSLSLIQACVGTDALTHVYATTSVKHDPIYKVVKSVLGQIISIRPNVLMVSYTGGELAKMHHHYHLNHNEDYKRMIQELIQTELDNSSIRLSKLEVFHFDHAIGLWKQNPGSKAMQTQCAIVHPTQLPGLYVVNENISQNYQGWSEGSLEVMEEVIQHTRRPKSGLPLYTMDTLPANTVVYDGRVLDVSEWKNIHPGTTVAINAHMKQDITDLWDGIHGTRAATKQIMLSLVIGYLQ
jgi:hypothetical protein